MLCVLNMTGRGVHEHRCLAVRRGELHGIWKR
jgi:hypothetical protein